jgi:hypothetical protein
MTLGRVDFTPADLAAIKFRPKQIRGSRPGAPRRPKPVIRFEREKRA